MALNIEVSLDTDKKFTNSKDGDIVFFTDYTDQQMLFGLDTSKRALLTLSNSQIKVDSSILPTVNEVYDIGAANARFRDLYLSGNTINLGGVKLKADTSNNVVVTDQNNALKRLVVSEIQIGSNVSSAVVLKTDSTGQVTMTTSTGTTANIVGGSGGGGTAYPLSDSVTTASSTTGASATAVKTAYDLAAAALPKTGGQVTGDLALTGNLSLQNKRLDFQGLRVLPATSAGLPQNITSVVTQIPGIDTTDSSTITMSKPTTTQRRIRLVN